MYALAAIVLHAADCHNPLQSGTMQTFSLVLKAPMHTNWVCMQITAYSPPSTTVQQHIGYHIATIPCQSHRSTSADRTWLTIFPRCSHIHCCHCCCGSAAWATLACLLLTLAAISEGSLYPDICACQPPAADLPAPLLVPTQLLQRLSASSLCLSQGSWLSPSLLNLSQVQCRHHCHCCTRQVPSDSPAGCSNHARHLLLHHLSCAAPGVWDG